MYPPFVQVGDVSHMIAPLALSHMVIHKKVSDRRKMSTVCFEPWTSGLTVRCTDSMSDFDRNVGEVCTLHPGIQGTMDSKVQWLETSDNKLY